MPERQCIGLDEHMYELIATTVYAWETMASSHPRKSSSVNGVSLQRKRRAFYPLKFWKISATSSQFRKQARPWSLFCFRPLSVITSPFSFTITSFGTAVMLNLFLRSLQEKNNTVLPKETSCYSIVWPLCSYMICLFWIWGEIGLHLYSLWHDSLLLRRFLQNKMQCLHHTNYDEQMACQIGVRLTLQGYYNSTVFFPS